MVVGDAYCRPHAANLLFPFAEHFEVPYLLGVGNGEALATVGIAILFDELAHQSDGLSGRGATLQGNAFQLFNHEHALGILQLLAAADGGLADAQLPLVDAGVGGVEEGIGVTRLRNLSLDRHARLVGHELGVHTAVVDGCHRVALVGGGGYHVDPRAIPAVARMAGDDRSVGAGFLAHHDAGAALRIFLIDRLTHCLLRKCQTHHE